MVLVGATNHREPVPLRDEHVQQTPVLCAQPPTSPTYAAKGWYPQPSTEVCTCATRVASPPESQSWKCLGDYILSGQPVANYWGTGAKPSSPASTLGQTLRCNLCSGAPCGIRRRLALHPILQLWQTLFLPLPCYPHLLTIFYWENFLNKTTCTWIQPETSWQPFFTTEMCPGMELGPQMASSESFRYF